MNFTWKGDETKNQGLVVRNAIVPTNSRPFYRCQVTTH